MAQDEALPLDGHLGIVPHARPARLLDRRRAVVVADDEMLAAGQRGEQFGDAVGRRPEGEIAEMPDLVVGRDRFVPARDDASSISLIDAKGRLSTRRRGASPKCVSLVKKTSCG